MILVIDKSKSAAGNLADAFHTMGILSNALTPQEALSEISRLYRAAVITSPASIPDILGYLRSLKQYAPDIPIFAVGEDSYEEGLFCRTFPLGLYAARLAAKIVDACEEDGFALPTRYMLAGIDASPENGESTLFGDTLPFTKTENMILRCLIRAYPDEMPAEKILTYAYRADRMPEAPNIRTHICSINKKFELLTGRALVTTSYGRGYVILTPERLEKATV